MHLLRHASAGRALLSLILRHPGTHLVPWDTWMLMHAGGMSRERRAHTSHHVFSSRSSTAWISTAISRDYCMRCCLVQWLHLRHVAATWCRCDGNVRDDAKVVVDRVKRNRKVVSARWGRIRATGSVGRSMLRTVSQRGMRALTCLGQTPRQCSSPGATRGKSTAMRQINNADVLGTDGSVGRRSADGQGNVGIASVANRSSRW